MLNIKKIGNQNVLNDPVHHNILGYDVAMCNLSSLTLYLNLQICNIIFYGWNLDMISKLLCMQLFLPVLLSEIEHWYCFVINLIDKRIQVLDSMMLKCREKQLTIAKVVSTFSVCREMVLFFLHTFECKCHFIMYLFCWS